MERLSYQKENNFEHIASIRFEGKDTINHLAYRYYNPQHKILGKTMEDHLRLAVGFWHTSSWADYSIFGEHFSNPMHRAELRVHAAFEFIEKLNLKFFTFNDQDIAPQGASLRETNRNLLYIAEKIAAEIERTNIKLLWGSADLISHRRYLAGAATNPNPEVFAYAAAQVKQALDITHHLHGENYLLWGGREGYDTLLNTDMRQELEQLARFLIMLVDYKHKIGFKGALLIEPKPSEPANHQYDYDVGTIFAFLQKYHLEKEFKINIEANHAALAGHTFPHEVSYAYAHNLLGSINANQGHPQLGTDTDTLSLHFSDIVQVLYMILQQGGFTTGGFNLDTTLRKQSIDLVDLFHGQVRSVDTLARALLIAGGLVKSGEFEHFIRKRYAEWHSPLGQEILEGRANFELLTNFVLHENLDPQPHSGRQEMLENLMMINSYI